MLHNMRVLVVGEHFFIISKMNKTSCFKSRHFINIYIINRTLHGRLGIRILSSRAEKISHSFASLTRERYFQHSKIKFVSPRGHVISSIYNIYRILHGRAEIRNFSSSVEKYFSIERSERVKYFPKREEKFRIFKRPCNILFSRATDSRFTSVFLRKCPSRAMGNTADM